MAGRPRAIRPVRILAGIGLEQRHHLRQRARREVRRHRQDGGRDRHLADRREVRDRVIADTPVQRRVLHVRSEGQQRGVTVLCCAGNVLGTRGGARARLVVDDDRLAPAPGQFLPDQPRHGVVHIARHRRHHDGERARRIGLGGGGIGGADCRRDGRQQHGGHGCAQPCGTVLHRCVSCSGSLLWCPRECGARGMPTQSRPAPRPA
ncbi:hypothetical protein D3C72_1685160 [compost metagenome]